MKGVRVLLLYFIGGFVICYCLLVTFLDRWICLQELEESIPLSIEINSSINGNQSNFYRNTNFDKSYTVKNLTKETVFLHKAFYDLRDPAGPRIRLLITATCAGLDAKFSILIFGKDIGVQWIFCTNNIKCPNKHECTYWHYDIGSKVYQGKVPEKITVIRNGNAVEVALHRSPANYSNTLSACVGALHWFNDWPRMIVYLELWRRQGAHKILLNVQSVSKTVKRVLDYYVKEGFVKIHQWPLLPFSSTYDPNDRVYYVSRNLETQHCLFWSDSKYTFEGDADDFLYIRNSSLSFFEYFETWFQEKKDLGALSFPHVGLAFRPRIIQKPYKYENVLSFDALRKPKVFSDPRYPKSVFLTEYVKSGWVHYPRKYFGGKKRYNVSLKEGLYLHARMNFDFEGIKDETPTPYPDVRFFEEKKGKRFIADIQKKMGSILEEIGGIAREIFGNETPEYRGFEVQTAIRDCIERLKASKASCVDPGVSCFEEVFLLDDWWLAEPTEESYYIIL